MGKTKMGEAGESPERGGNEWAESLPPLSGPLCFFLGSEKEASARITSCKESDNSRSITLLCLRAIFFPSISPYNNQIFRFACAFVIAVFIIF